MCSCAVLPGDEPPQQLRRPSLAASTRLLRFPAARRLGLLVVQQRLGQLRPALGRLRREDGEQLLLRSDLLPTDVQQQRLQRGLCRGRG